ncbi:DUF262 domain-containing protein [Psychrobacter sp. I-STPA6b]|uniref:DUF262 domain-containing protein n=1 Tax=Psychrobacter sp. I-STPA6b TaxID=2585718 RepID=UPI001D0C4F30|nr:DUF262 domain-containing protein [Psychrobacter sp. I-STPA6b]
MQNILKLKTINELRDCNFIIPSYQRGYRWTATEITELLNDINSFTPRAIDSQSDDKTWYCLQPIVVKKTDNEEFEVIDGQQRLTTIYLILFYLNQDYIISKREKIFKLNYETRPSSSLFLESLEDNQKINESNIDFYYISKAYITISAWFDKKNQDISFDKLNFSSKFKFHSRVIWYESIEDDAISIFTRINIGKIPLTNSELIKALFLNSSNFNEQDNKLKLRQLEIANEWDRIEGSLQDDRFWYFINKERKFVNRIEFIFDLMNENPDSKDKLATFRFFSKKFRKPSNDILSENWNEIKDYYNRFYEWYKERSLYHKIGCLITVNAINIKELYKESCSKKKSDFHKYLDEKIKFSLRKISVRDLQYNDTTEVRKILLLYNILTMLSSDKDNSYFPFDLYENQKWDIEHITSIKNRVPDEKNRKQWLVDSRTFIDTEALAPDSHDLIDRIDSWDESEESFIILFEEINNHFNQHIKLEDDVDSLFNLTLLDSTTNRSYKNAVFPIKRKTIIDRDKKGIFIPICTKNVFLKYFSSYPPKISFWTQLDKENYENDLITTLEKYNYIEN